MEFKLQIGIKIITINKVNLISVLLISEKITIYLILLLNLLSNLLFFYLNKAN
jgi:hypothetical protein